jgi:hypothetical protein
VVFLFLCHPHHLIYTFLAKLFYLWGKDNGATWDGLAALQFFDILTGTLGVLIAFHLLVRETDNRLIAVLAAGGIAFSHSYWYFSTIPGVRIFATVTPLFAWYVLTYQKNKPAAFGWVVGLAHVLAVLGHQTNLLLVPAFLGGILLLKEKTLWYRLKACFYYLTALTIGVLFTYGFIGRYIYYRTNLHDWLWWVFSYFHAAQKWGGYLKPSGFERGQSAMVLAFLSNIPHLKTMGDESMTYGAAETIFQYSILVLLAVLLLRIKYYWDNHRQALWISILWIAAFVPFFVWWEPWNIEFWVSSTIPCWVMMGLVVSDLSNHWKNPVLHFANLGIVAAVWTALMTLLYLYNIEGGEAKTVANHYDFKGLLGALEWKVGENDLLVIDGINNVHYYIDRFEKRGYLSLYNYLRQYKNLEKPEIVKKTKGKRNHPAPKPHDVWTDLSDTFQETWKHHHKVYVLTEAVNEIDGGRQLLEETMHLPQGRVREFFKQYQLKPVSYQGQVYYYEVVRPPDPDPVETTAPDDATEQKQRQ